MMLLFLIRQPPAGTALRLAELAAIARERDPGPALVAGLSARLGGASVTLHASGREALRVALALLAQRSGRDEVLMPAYTCYSVPAAAVAAGLRVRLVDVTRTGAVDPAALAAIPLERVVALVVSNLFGVPEPIAPLREQLAGTGVTIVDDAAQALGGRSTEGPVGARGDIGIFSFGRGKPLSALGGGAIAWTSGAAPASVAIRPRRGLALARAVAYSVALQPWLFRSLSSLPGLHIGETRFEPVFTRGQIDGAALCLARAALDRFEEEGRRREGRARATAERLREETQFEAIQAEGEARGVYPRLGVLAPNAPARADALARLSDLGVTGMYPESLDAVLGLRAHRADEGGRPAARDLAARVLTLPMHGGLRPAQWDRLFTTLARLS